jgi:hypothetical protein
MLKVGDIVKRRLVSGIGETKLIAFEEYDTNRLILPDSESILRFSPPEQYVGQFGEFEITLESPKILQAKLLRIIPNEPNTHQIIKTPRNLFHEFPQICPFCRKMIWIKHSD